MKRNFDLLVFDWDGTLVDSAAHIVSSIQAACRDLDLPVPSDSNARYVIGLGLQDALEYVLPDLDTSRYADVAERYRIHFLGSNQGSTLFPHVGEGIARLDESGILLAVATGKSRRGLDRSLQLTGLTGRFSASRCADEGFPKPHPDMLERLMYMLGVSPQRTLMIGDTTHDLNMASNAGTAAVAVTYGAHPRPALEELSPLTCVESFGELMQWLDGNA